MKKQFSYAILALAPLACKNATPQRSLPEVIEKQAINILNPFQQSDYINQQLKGFSTAPQKFVVSSGSRHQLVGKKGTIIELESNDLETIDGSPITKQIDVALLELQNQNDFLRNNISTTSDGRLLVSGGAYYINCSAAGKALRIKKGKTIAISIPKLAGEKMNLFYGEKTETGNINWRPSPRTFEDRSTPDSVWTNVPKFVAKDTMYGSNWRTRFYPSDKTQSADGTTTQDSNAALNNELTYVLDTEYHRQKMAVAPKPVDDAYEQINIVQLGWINCDRFYNAEKMDLAIDLPVCEQRIFIKTFIVYKSINSVTEHEFTTNEQSTQVVIPGLPANQSVRVTSLAYYDGKVHTFSKEIKLKPHAHLELEMKPSSQQEIDRLFAANTKM